jgi:hypothetical protein
MNALRYGFVKASFTDFRISGVCGGFFWEKKIAYSLVCNMWKVYTRFD